MIQQEYGVELSDESITALYDSKGNTTKEELYVVDTAGQLHQYIIVGSEFHFVQLKGESAHNVI